VRGRGGRRAGSASKRQVASLPGASSAAVRRWRALESSPFLTLAHACSRFRSAIASASTSAPRLRCVLGRRAAASRCTHSPRRKAAARASSSSRPRAPWRCVRARSMRGTRRNNFHARDAGASPRAGTRSAESRSCCRAVVNAARTAARMTGGTSCGVGTGHRSSSAKSTVSKANHAASGTLAGVAFAAASWSPEAGGQEGTTSSAHSLDAGVGTARAAERRRAPRRRRRVAGVAGGWCSCRASFARLCAAAAAEAPA